MSAPARRRLVGSADDLVRWTAGLFIVGSTCFALGSFPPFGQNVDPGTVGLVFFGGSLFFTAAAALQFVVEARAERSRGGAAGPSFLGHGQSWWASLVQLVGTVLFNVSTFDALLDGLSTEETNRLVWAPDLFGSIAFLVASWLGWRVVCPTLWCVRRDDTDWSMAAWNGVGSVLFMVSAVASLTLPTTGETLNLTLVNSGTFLGAVCFLAGAWLLLPVDE
jgi:hypothetical protein